MSTSIRSRRARVLLIDDEPSIRAVYPEVLGADYDVQVAASGREGLDAVSERADYDVIVCDLTMPDTDGPAFYAELRNRAPQLVDRVVFCSGGLVTARLRAFAASIPNTFLEKPIAVETLCAAIERVVRRQPTR
jgi:CheY-like chemotaxis protein